MSNQHKSLPNAEIHVPLGHAPATTGSQPWKDERDQWSFETRFELPPVLNIVDNTVAPPTEVDGDIYIIDNTGASHADWDGATANSWVRYNAADDAWNEVPALEGMTAYDKTGNAINKFDGSAWSAAGSGVTSVSGTASRITSTGGTTPVIDIDAAYVGQTSITTLGTIATGTWQGTAIDQAYLVGQSGTNTGDQTITLTGDVTGSGTGSFATTIAAGAVDIAMLSATGTPDGTTYLRGDNTWATIAAGDTGNILDTSGLTMAANRTHTLTDTFNLTFQNSTAAPILHIESEALTVSRIGIGTSSPASGTRTHIVGGVSQAVLRLDTNNVTNALLVDAVGDTSMNGTLTINHATASKLTLTGATAFSMVSTSTGDTNVLQLANNASDAVQLVQFATKGNINSSTNNFEITPTATIKVSIGSATFNAKLHVQGHAGVHGLFVQANGGTSDLVVPDGGGVVSGATSIDSSARMEIVSTTQGFLPPRMTGTQVEAIATPATGLTAYATAAGSGDVTAAGWWGYNGANWVQLG